MIPRSRTRSNKTLLLCLSVWFFTLSLPAIDISTQISLVSHEQDHQLLGSFSLKLSNDAFSDASPNEPLYVRFRTLHSQGWSHTLVDMRPETGDAPINLAVFPVNQSTQINPNLNPDAVQLVRLIKGEREGWIRINRSSSTWVAADVIGVAPSPDRPVAFSLGLRGSQSVRNNANTVTRGNERADLHYLADTSLFANYRDTSSFRVGTLERLDFIAVDSRTFGVEIGQGVLLGGSLSVSFSDDVVVARGAAYVPCFEFHNVEDSFDTTVVERTVNRFDLIRARTFGLQVPALYLTNSSDFVWEEGTRLFVTLPEFSGRAYADGDPQSITRLDTTREFVWQATDLQVTSSGSSQWRVEKIMWNENVFAGYELILESGEYDVFETLTLTGMIMELDDDFRNESIRLAAHAVYTNQIVTQGELAHLGPLTHTLFELAPGEDNFHRQVLSYTAYDEPEWLFEGHVVNPHDQSVDVTMLFYNRHGILLGVLPAQPLAAHAKNVFDVASLFGDAAADVLSWVEVLSRERVGVAAVIENTDGTTLDVYPGVSDSRDTLYGAHLPANLESWRTKAAVVANNLAEESSFFLELPGQGETRLPGFFFPGGTAILDDQYFVNNEVRSPWFRLNAVSAEGGNGLLFFSRSDHLAQLVSTPLDLQPTREWRFDHLGQWQNAWWNGLVVTNPGENSVPILVNLYNAEGDKIEDFPLVLAPGEKSAELLANHLNGVLLEPYHRMDVIADEPILSFLLMGQDGKPVATRVRGNLEGSRGKLLPIAFGADRAKPGYTGLALINPFALETEIEITPYTAAGEARPTVSVSIPRFSKSINLLETLLGDDREVTHLHMKGTRSFTAFGLVGSRDNQQLATVDVINLD
ncbi:hypothetical protein [Acanthopleuribacter pedis]|uniref:Uncharacterized protein n=1 Tax=Acanthopleuribacter pedis TaxID=442870 RepID=A0A8J7Q9N4_9BACT|nr:hypothetical protein [Acanthopleuribacter pedis]MBO1321226.1 hypothetical protein [Acanthopleuribacter pedis]